MEQLKRKMFQVVNESGLPLEAIYYVCKDFFRDVDDAYKHFLSQQAKKEQEEQKEKE